MKNHCGKCKKEIDSNKSEFLSGTEELIIFKHHCECGHETVYGVKQRKKKESKKPNAK